MLMDGLDAYLYEKLYKQYIKAARKPLGFEQRDYPDKDGLEWSIILQAAINLIDKGNVESAGYDPTPISTYMVLRLTPAGLFVWESWKGLPRSN
jgi:hypothetical protein